MDLLRRLVGILSFTEHHFKVLPQTTFFAAVEFLLITPFIFYFKFIALICVIFFLVHTILLNDSSLMFCNLVNDILCVPLKIAFQIFVYLFLSALFTAPVVVCIEFIYPSERIKICE